MGFAKSLLVYLVLCVATYLMLRILIDYTAFRDDVGFLRFKTAYVNYPWWKAAFYTHVFTAILALVAGFTQFSSLVLQDHRRLHQVVGRIHTLRDHPLNRSHARFDLHQKIHSSPAPAISSSSRTNGG